MYLFFRFKLPRDLVGSHSITAFRKEARFFGKTFTDESRLPRVHGEAVQETTCRSCPTNATWTGLLVPASVWYVSSQETNKIHVVFDSSASCEGLSLNDALLTGPALNNSLLCVLTRFRKVHIAITTDIEHISLLCRAGALQGLSLLVQEQWPYLWHHGLQNASSPFWNGPSPAVDIYGLQQAAKEAEAHGSDIKRFIDRKVYVYET